MAPARGVCGAGRRNVDDFRVKGAKEKQLAESDPVMQC